MDDGTVPGSTCHVDNLVEGLILAASRGRPGEVYFVTDGEAMAFRKFASAYLSTAGVVPPNGSVPGWVLRAAGAILESAWNILRLDTQPPVNRVEAAMVSEPQVFSDAKARRELSYEPVISFDHAITQLNQTRGITYR